MGCQSNLELVDGAITAELPGENMAEDLRSGEGLERDPEGYDPFIDTGSPAPDAGYPDPNVSEVVDCNLLSDVPLFSVQFGEGPRGYHDLAFTDAGEVLGIDGTFNSDLVSALYGASENSLISPNLSTIQGMQWGHDGELYVAHDTSDALQRVDLETGGTLRASPDLGGNTYGLVVASDGFAYTGSAGAADVIHRIDLSTGEGEVLIDDADLTFSPRPLNFSPDFSKLYIGTFFGDGRIYVVDLDENLDPMLPVRTFADGVGTGEYHDALGVDACGNLYMTDFSTRDMYRITPEGTTSLYYDFNDNDFEFLRPRFAVGQRHRRLGRPFDFRPTALQRQPGAGDGCWGALAYLRGHRDSPRGRVALSGLP